MALAEALLFLADEPLSSRKIAQVLGLEDGSEARRLVLRLQTLLEKEGSAFQVQHLAGGFQLTTQPHFHAWLPQIRPDRGTIRLSGAARETLAVVAYRQPITRAEIERIRGVACGEVLKLLMERGLVRIVGRHDSLGRPVLYGTSRKFLQSVGINSLDQLPMAAQLRVPSEASDAS
jgi:segregation and condensation protein B